MAEDKTTSESVDQEPTGLTSRRWLLRGGAVAAGAAGLAAMAAAVPSQAHAADGDPVELGAPDNDSSETTAVTISSGANPTLALNNDDGPSLYLQPLNYEEAPALELGQVANTQLGPVIGVDSEVGETTTFLATGIDLADLPTPYALPSPVRILDTRSSAGRDRVLRSSTSPATEAVFDAAGRMKAGTWIDIEVTPEDAEYAVPSAFVNMGAVHPDGNGFLTVYPPGTRPPTSTLNYVKGQAIANQAFLATRIVFGRFAIRIYTSTLTHVIADLNGVTLRGTAPTPQGKAARRANANAGTRLRTALAEKLHRSLAR